MSLTSRVANLFSSGSTSSTQRDHKILALGDDGLPGRENIPKDTILGTDAIGSEAMAPQALEEEDRPPYLHVTTLDWPERKMLIFCSQ